MRIDFKGRYGEVAALIERPPQARTEPHSFEPILSSLVAESDLKTKQNQSVATTPENFFGRSPQAPEGSPMGRFRFSEPLPQVPKAKPLLAPEPPPVVNATTTSVKTPTILSVSRIRTEGAPKEASTSSSSAATNSAVPMPAAEPQKVDVHALVQQAGKEQGIDPALGMAVAAVESGYDSNAVSSDGHASKGLFQLLDSTGKQLLEQSGTSAKYDPFNPKLNVALGISYLRRLHDLFSQPSTLGNNATTVAAANSASLEKLAVAAFNAGEGRVASAQKRAAEAGKDPSKYEVVAPYLPDSTQEYVRKVMTLRSQFENQSIG